MASEVLGPEARVPRTVLGAGRPPVERFRLVTFERSLADVGVSELERTVDEISAESLDGWFVGDPSLREMGLLRTCQRVVVLALTDGQEGDRRLSDWLGSREGWTKRSDTEAVRHLFRVSAGLDSRAPGEREIRDQVRAASGGIRSRHPRPILRDLLLHASDAAATLGHRASGSVADLAVDWLLPRLSGPGAGVLVIGSGTVGRRAAERLADRARVTIIYHHRPPDVSWAARWNVSMRPSAEMIDAARGVEAVVAAAKTTGRVLRASDLPPASPSGPRWFVDLGLPRNIDPEIGQRAGCELVDLDGLPRGQLPPELRSEMERIIESAADRAALDLAAAAAEPWVSELRRWAEAIRREEWDRATAHAGSVPDSARLAYERLSERLVRRLLSGPTRELRAVPPGPELDLWRRRVVELFQGSDAGP